MKFVIVSIMDKHMHLTLWDEAICYFYLHESHYILFCSQVCPICSIKVSRDMLSHITLQHGHLLKISFVWKFVIV